MSRISKRNLSTLILIIGLAIAVLAKTIKSQISVSSQPTPTPTLSPVQVSPTPTPAALLYYPIEKFSQRLNYRFYGTQVTGEEPKNLPCGFPFTGLHTGDDLEALNGEDNQDISVFSIANGKVIQVGNVNGYGGLIVIQHHINNADFMAYYGHIRLTSVQLKKSSIVLAGQKIAVLGKGCTAETDKERTHLHFAIQQGTQIDVRGYAQSRGELGQWLDPAVFLNEGAAAEPDPSQVLGISVSHVSKVIDGDTFQLATGEKVRLIGINTPETVDPRRPVQCYGKQASDKAKELLTDKDVRMEKDVSETDKYGRLLRYVWIGDIFVNEYLVKEGFAQASSYPPDVKYNSLFKAAEKQAKDGKLGLWADICK